MKIAIIDNYDSFTYNLSHLVKALGAEVTVYRNDQFEPPTVRGLLEDHPLARTRHPVGGRTAARHDPHLCRQEAHPRCLSGSSSHRRGVWRQSLENLSDVFHGVATEGTQFGNDEIFSGLPSRITMGRYHSWVVSKEGFPDCLEVTAESDEGQIMALRHKTMNIRGIQFHPESVLTPDGQKMLQNWMFL